MAVRRLAAVLLVAAAGLCPAQAQVQGPRPAPPSHLDPKSIEIDEQRHLGTPLDPALQLIGEDGRRFALRELLGKPLLLLFSYYSCDGACPTVNRQLAAAIASAQRFRSGEDYRVLTVSFDPRDDAAGLRRFVQLNTEGAGRGGWRFSLFADGADIRRIAESVGYKWFWSVRDRLFVHPNVLVVLTPEGRIARYLPAWAIGPRDIDLALIEADWGRVGNAGRLIDIATGLCFSYSYRDGRYVLNLPLFVAAGSLTLGFAAIVGGFAIFRRRRARQEVQLA